MAVFTLDQIIIIIIKVSAQLNLKGYSAGLLLSYMVSSVVVAVLQFQSKMFHECLKFTIIRMFENITLQMQLKELYVF